MKTGITMAVAVAVAAVVVSLVGTSSRIPVFVNSILLRSSSRNCCRTLSIRIQPPPQPPQQTRCSTYLYRNNNNNNASSSLVAPSLLFTIPAMVSRSSSACRLYSSINNNQNNNNSEDQIDDKEESNTGENNSNSNRNSNPNGWELMEDWILQDCVPDFTVRTSSTSSTSTSATTTRSTTMATTFWRQLKHTIPELSQRSELELRDRYTTLALGARREHEEFNTNNNNNTNNTKKNTNANTKRFIVCGRASPEVLQQWSLDIVTKRRRSGDETASSDAVSIIMMQGRLSSNGSNIWFPIQAAGTVGLSSSSSSSSMYSNNNIDDNTNTNSNNNMPPSHDFSWLLESDGDGNGDCTTKYVVNSAGCVYELGLQQQQQQQQQQAVVLSSSTTSLESGSFVLSPLASMQQATISVGMTISAVIASSLLSAALVFMTVQVPTTTTTPSPLLTTSSAILSPASQKTSGAIVPVRKQQQQEQTVTASVIGNGMNYERILQPDGTIKVVELSISEQRASQEIRVYRTERRIQGMETKLVRDGNELQQLKTVEAEQSSRTTPSAMADSAMDRNTAIPRSPKDLPISEQRARAELKVGADQRRIVRMQTNLVTEKEQLQQLQLQEQQQQR